MSQEQNVYKELYDIKQHAELLRGSLETVVVRLAKATGRDNLQDVTLESLLVEVEAKYGAEQPEADCKECEI